jgi:hypothetical protein
MILAELERLEPGLIPVLRRRAAAWCLANGRPEEALEYSMAAGDIDVVAGLVEGSLGLACDRWRHRSTGGRWQVPAGYPAGRARSRGLLADRCLDGPARNVAGPIHGPSCPAGPGLAGNLWPALAGSSACVRASGRSRGRRGCSHHPWDQEQPDRQNPGQGGKREADRPNDQGRPGPPSSRSEGERPCSGGQQCDIPPCRRTALPADDDDVDPGVSGGPYRSPGH